MSVNNPAAIAAYLGNPLSLEQFDADHPLNQINRRSTNPVAPGEPLIQLLSSRITNTDLQTIPNQSPDIGLSPGFNAWMTFFGQFFDHGLDLVTKGGNGTVYVPLQADDPLIAGADGISAELLTIFPPHLQFMALTRATPMTGQWRDRAREHHDLVRRPEPDLYLACLAPGVPARVCEGRWQGSQHRQDAGWQHGERLGRLARLATGPKSRPRPSKCWASF